MPPETYRYKTIYYQLNSDECLHLPAREASAGADTHQQTGQRHQTMCVLGHIHAV